MAVLLRPAGFGGQVLPRSARFGGPVRRSPKDVGGSWPSPFLFWSGRAEHGREIRDRGLGDARAVALLAEEADDPARQEQRDRDEDGAEDEEPELRRVRGEPALGAVDG